MFCFMYMNVVFEIIEGWSIYETQQNSGVCVSCRVSKRRWWGLLQQDKGRHRDASNNFNARFGEYEQDNEHQQDVQLTR